MPLFIGGLVVGAALTLMICGVIRAARPRHEEKVWAALEELLREKSLASLTDWVEKGKGRDG